MVLSASANRSTRSRRESASAWFVFENRYSPRSVHMNEQHPNRSGETCEWAALAALDALTPEDKAAYERHRREGCAVCEADLRSFEEVLGRLASGSDPSALPPC